MSVKRHTVIMLAVAGSVLCVARQVYAAETRTATTALVCAPPTKSRICYPPRRYPVLQLPGGEQQIVRSMLNITKPMHFGDFVWDDKNVPAGMVWVRIDLRRQLLSVFRDGHEIGSSVIVYGSDGKPTPTGIFSILEKDAHHFSSTYGSAPMPYTLRLTKDGVAIHGSVVREGWATHGCIGIPLEFARLLFGATSRGDRIVILQG